MILIDVFLRKDWFSQMNHKVWRKLLSVVLAVLMLSGTIVSVAAADSSTNTSGVSLATSSEDTTIDYNDYQTLHENDPVASESSEVIIDAVDYDKANTTSKVSVLDEYSGEEDVLRIEETDVNDTTSGEVTWTFDVPETGMYCFEFTYASVFSLQDGEITDTDRKSDIERVFYLNGEVPFSEARAIYFKKLWKYEVSDSTSVDERGFTVDSEGNESRPNTVAVHDWQTYSFENSNGYYQTPYKFYLEKGKNTLTLEGVREAVALKQIRVYGYEDLPTYEEVQEEYEANGYTDATADPIHIDAESPTYVSDFTLYPQTDRSSSITEPSSSTTTYKNVIGGETWSTSGQSVTYTFDVSQTGLYTIATRFNQSLLRGMYSSRRILIDGEIPFQEANNCCFNYDTSWQVERLNDGTSTFKFYLEEGTHTLTFSVGLGMLTDVVNEVNNIMGNINSDYLELIKITGSEPDENRDYGFSRIMPDVIDDLYVESQDLQYVIEVITNMSGIKSDNTSTLETVANLLETMGTDEDAIAGNLDELSTQVSSLGTWVNNVLSQTLMIDYIEVLPESSDLSKANDNFFQAFGFETSKFFASFYTDYSSVSSNSGGEDKTSLEVWTTTGRDQSQIIKNLVDDGFDEANVTIKLVSTGTLMPAILAGNGPDISADATSPLDMAIRGALVPLNDFDTYDDVMSRFNISAYKSCSLYGTTYAIPVTQAVPLLYYREDILADLGLEIPRTWDDLMAMVPVLQFNNMTIGIPAEFSYFIYQTEDGDFWKMDGMASDLDSATSLDTFSTMCNYFTQFSLPLSYSAMNRFASAEMPVMISDYTLYNTLQLSAPEIQGLWDFTTVPGTEYEDGTVNSTSYSISQGIVMCVGCAEEDREVAWDFMDWFSDSEYQIDYSNEMVALLGLAAKSAVANMEALQDLPWTASEYKVLESALLNSNTVTPYPGDYYQTRYLSSSVNEAYADLVDPAETLQAYVPSINKEITRKRSEFNMLTTDDWTEIQAQYGYESYEDWCAIRDYLGFTPDIQNKKTNEHEQWVAYMEENGITDYKTFMEDEGISAEEYTELQEAMRNVSYSYEYLSYGEWVQIRREFGFSSYYEWRAIQLLMGYETSDEFAADLEKDGISSYEDFMSKVGITLDDYNEFTTTMGKVKNKMTVISYTQWCAVKAYLGLESASDISRYMSKNDISTYDDVAISLGIKDEDYISYLGEILSGKTSKSFSDWLA